MSVELFAVIYAASGGAWIALALWLTRKRD
jgi:hypothetical protein